MRAIAHRGWWWPRRELQNHPASVLAALSNGFGAEVDVWGIRDQRLVLRHDESSAVYEMALPQPACGTIFLHVKAAKNGTAEGLVDILRLRGWLEHTYLFCSPSNDGLLARMKEVLAGQLTSIGLRTLTTVVDPLGLDVLLDQPDPLGGADGVWLEQPDEDWVDADAIDTIHRVGKTAWVVSPELHGWKLDLGMVAQEWGSADGLVTDYPHLIERVTDATDPHVHPKEPWWQ